MQQAVDNCNAQSNGAYKIKYQKLPNGADGQRQQMVRRLAAEDSSMDILGLDVTWAPEFAEAGWIQEWTGDNKTQVEQRHPGRPARHGHLPGQALGGAVQQQHPAALVPLRPRAHPAQDVGRDDQDGRATSPQQGKPHYIEIQGNQYEGITVWFNTLLASAGGSVLNEAGTAPSLGPPAVTALDDHEAAGHVAGGRPVAVGAEEDDNRLAMESGTAAFELNYPFVYPSMKKNKPDMFAELQVGALPGGDRRPAVAR